MCLWVHILRQQLYLHLAEYHSLLNTKSQQKTVRTSKVMKMGNVATRIQKKDLNKREHFGYQVTQFSGAKFFQKFYS